MAARSRACLWGCRARSSTSGEQQLPSAAKGGFCVLVSLALHPVTPQGFEPLCPPLVLMLVVPRRRPFTLPFPGARPPFGASTARMEA
jgi:hypothetical protein